MPKLTSLSVRALPDVPAPHTPQSMWVMAKALRAMYETTGNASFFAALKQLQVQYNLVGWARELEKAGRIGEGAADRMLAVLNDSNAPKVFTMGNRAPIFKLRDAAFVLNPMLMSSTEIIGLINNSGVASATLPQCTGARQTARNRLSPAQPRWRGFWVDANGDRTMEPSKFGTYVEREIARRGEDGAGIMQPIDPITGAFFCQSEYAWGTYGAGKLVSSPLYIWNAQAWALRAYHKALITYWTAEKGLGGKAGVSSEEVYELGCPFFGRDSRLRMHEALPDLARQGLALADWSYNHKKFTHAGSQKLPFYLPSTQPLAAKDAVYAPGTVLVRHYVHEFLGPDLDPNAEWPFYNPWRDVERITEGNVRDWTTKQSSFIPTGTRRKTLAAIIDHLATELDEGDLQE
jgi:hypothetical protein